MSSGAPSPASLDPDTLAVIARAEVGRSMLERLAVIGMELAEEIRERHVQAPLHPEPRHDPARAFALVSRAVRLTLAFIARIDADILAIRKGEASSLSRSCAGSRLGAASKAPADKPVVYPATLALGPEGARVRDAVGSAIHAEFEECDGAMDALDELHERLVDYERRDGFVSRPWRETVDAICADLGLEPDWSQWSDDTGFPGKVGRPHVRWTMLWKYDPKRSELRRKRAAKRLEAGCSAEVARPPPDPPPRAGA